MLSLISVPSPTFPRTLLDDTQTVPVLELPPTRHPSLKSTPLPQDKTTVMLTPPVLGPLLLTTLLRANDTPAKLTPRLRLDRTPPEVAAKLTPVSHPSPLLHPMLLDDTHTLPTLELPPTRTPTLRFTAPTDDTAIVMLVEPVVAPFVLTTLLNTNDAPSKL